MIRSALLLLFVLHINCSYVVYTGATVVIFNTTGLGIQYHARDKETGEPSDNAFVVSFNNAREVTPSGELVQILDRSAIPLTFNVSSERTPTADSQLLYDDAFQITYSSTTGVKFTFWVFTEDQLVTDVKTKRTFEVKEGSVKYSIEMALWPFYNEKNKLQFSSNLTTLLPDTLEYCYLPQEQSDDATTITCVADGLEGSLTLINSAITYSYETQQSSKTNTDVLFFACPTPQFEELVPILLDPNDRSEYCKFPIEQGESFPPGMIEEDTSEYVTYFVFFFHSKFIF